MHGGIDGFSRRVVYLHASDNNSADTVSNLFRAAVGQCGWPSRVCSDRGGENIDVARYCSWNWVNKPSGWKQCPQPEN